MQNCLHSKKSRKTCAVVFVLVFSVATAAAVRLALRLDSDVYNGTKYVSAVVSGTAEYTTAKNEKTDEKMNNDFLEIAKNDDKEPEINPLAEVQRRAVRVLAADGVVREMELEEYVEGCVLGEMPVSFDSQALMAQSIAVRTFTYRCMTAKSRHKGADVCTNPACCQSFSCIDSKKMSEENKRKLHECVAATSGVIMMYDGAPINAVYHASSGDRTLSSEEVWGGRLDYLVSVDAPDGESEIYSHGHGHRVGMSQHGANILAGQGKNYMEILKYYYSGVYFSFV